MAEKVLEGSQPVDLEKHPLGIVPTLQNIVSTVNLDCKLDLKAIALQARNAEYNPKVSFLRVPGWRGRGSEGAKLWQLSSASQPSYWILPFPAPLPSSLHAILATG